MNGGSNHSSNHHTHKNYGGQAYDDDSPPRLPTSVEPGLLQLIDFAIGFEGIHDAKFFFVLFFYVFVDCMRDGGLGVLIYTEGLNNITLHYVLCTTIFLLTFSTDGVLHMLLEALIVYMAGKVFLVRSFSLPTAPNQYYINK